MRIPSILLVEDDAGDRSLAAWLLGRSGPVFEGGPEVEEVSDAVGFAEALAGARFDLLVVGRELGWADGLELAERAKRVFPHRPVILLAGPVDAELASRAVAARLDALLEKTSAGWAELPRRAAQLLGRSRETASEELATGRPTGGDEAAARLAAAERELERARTDLAGLAHVVSHDLQAPLTRIDRYARLLADTAGDSLDETARGHVERIARSASQMQTLLDAVVEYSRVETKGGELEPVDLEEVVEEVREALAPEIAETGARFEREQLPTLEADRAQMVQLYRNLVANALKFHGDEPPEIHLSARRNGAGWELLVRDRGIGIAPADRERIFGMFERLHRDSEIPGSGVGLAICKRIAERRGGDIRVDSSEPGRGATFVVQLPDVPSGGR